jgi:hypothetical protein
MAERLLAAAEALGGMAQDAVLGNLTALPDTLLAGVALFALLLQSAPLATLAAALLAVSPAHALVARGLSAAIPGLGQGTGAGAERCSGRFAGVSLERLARSASSLDFDAGAVAWPSYYATFFGCLAAYVGLVPVTYAKELGAPRAAGRAAAVYGGLAVLALLLALVCAYRFLSGCDSAGSLVVGLALGAALGAVAHLGLAAATGRAATNLLGLPLLRGAAADGAPLYVCAS